MRWTGAEARPLSVRSPSRNGNCSIPEICCFKIRQRRNVDGCSIIESAARRAAAPVLLPVRDDRLPLLGLPVSFALPDRRAALGSTLVSDLVVVKEFRAG